jgi:TRAP-type uncharacterized transport system substrate-binding protein
MSDNVSRLIGRRSAGLGLGGLFLAANAWAETPTAAPPPPSGPAPGTAAASAPTMPLGVRPSRDVVTLMGSTLIGSYTHIADDIARVLSTQAPTAPRVLPVVAGGGLQVLWDLLNLDRIDGAILSSVVLDVVRRGGWLPELTRRLSYVSLLYFEETHIIASELIQNVYSLAGRAVNVGPVGGGTDVIARRMFQLLGIEPVYDNRPTLVAAQGVSSGDPAAVLFVAGKPVPAVAEIEIVGNLRFVPIPWSGELEQRVKPQFRATFLTSDDYPHLIPGGTRVPTLASPVFLVLVSPTPGSDRERVISSMIVNLAQNLLTLQYGDYHPKWREANLLEPLPGLRRAPAVVDWFNSTNGP